MREFIKGIHLRLIMARSENDFIQKKIQKTHSTILLNDAEEYVDKRKLGGSSTNDNDNNQSTIENNNVNNNNMDDDNNTNVDNDENNVVEKNEKRRKTFDSSDDIEGDDEIVFGNSSDNPIEIPSSPVRDQSTETSNLPNPDTTITTTTTITKPEIPNTDAPILTTPISVVPELRSPQSKENSINESPNQTTSSTNTKNNNVIATNQQPSSTIIELKKIVVTPFEDKSATTKNNVTILPVGTRKIILKTTLGSGTYGKQKVYSIFLF
jgi:hypothetical protein